MYIESTQCVAVLIKPGFAEYFDSDLRFSQNVEVCVNVNLLSSAQGRTQSPLWGGSPNPAGGLGGTVSPPAGSGAEPQKKKGIQGIFNPP